MMYRTITEHFKWQPTVIGGLFLDDLDHNGVIFWYDHVVEVNKKQSK
jgi:hypothetical protein